jgi:glycosyltransferase involved in cell wall biosynthesis
MRWQPARDAFVPGKGPNPFTLYEILAENGIDSEIIDPYQRPWNVLAGRGTVLESLDPLRALRVLTGRRKIDIVVSVFEGGSVPLVLARRLMGFHAPVVLWDIGLTEAWRLRERLLDIAVPRVDGILVLSSNQKPYIESRWPRHGRAEIILHYVDTDFFQASEDAPGNYILAVGDDQGRDFATLVKAAEDLPTEIRIKTRLPVKRDAVRNANVTVLSERMSHEELRNLYAGACFFVVPLTETLNASGVSSVLEAGAMGKALIISETQSMRDFIVPDETCLVVPPDNPKALREAMIRLRTDGDLRRRLGAQARAFIEAKFATRPFAKNFAAALRNYARI